MRCLYTTNAWLYNLFILKFAVVVIGKIALLWFQVDKMQWIGQRIMWR
jgi:hypothetical protein